MRLTPPFRHFVPLSPQNGEIYPQEKSFIPPVADAPALQYTPFCSPNMLIGEHFYYQNKQKHGEDVPLRVFVCFKFIPKKITRQRRLRRLL